MLVRDIMTRRVVAIGPEMPIGDVYALMEQRNIRHFPILELSSPTSRAAKRSSSELSSSEVRDDSSSLIGIVSDRDIRAVGSELPSLKKAVTVRDPVRSIMSSPVLTAHPLDPVEESARVLRERRIGAMPVTEDERLVGIVTATDFLEALTKMTGVFDPSTRLEVEVDNKPGALASLARAIAKRGLNVSSVLTNYKDADTLAFVLRVDTIDGRGLAQALRNEGFSVLWPVDKSEL
jgi:acetoin utilization protein AcuB